MHSLYELLEADFVRIDDTRSEVDRVILERQLEQECRLNGAVEELYKSAQNGSGNKLVIEIHKRKGFQEAIFKLETQDGKKQEIPESPKFMLARDESELTIDHAIARISEYIRRDLTDVPVSPTVYTLKSVEIKNFTPDQFDRTADKWQGLADIEVELKEKQLNRTTLQNYWDTTMTRILNQKKLNLGKKAAALLSTQKLIGNKNTVQNIALLHKILTKSYEQRNTETKDWYRLSPKILTTADSALSQATSIGVCNLFDRIYLDKTNLEEIKRCENSGEPLKLTLKGMLVAYKRLS